MRILYLDTSSSFLYCGLVEDNSLVFEIKKHYEKDLSKHTLFEIDNKFKENNISTDSVDKIIVVNGPGSFTGIRIGITIAKTYGWTLNIPVISISSLYAMALSTDDSGLKVPIIDARRGFVYASILDENNNYVMEDKYIKLSELIENLDKKNADYGFISNDTFDFETIKYSPDILKIVSNCKDNKVISQHSINPIYLKQTEAEENLNDSSNK